MKSSRTTPVSLLAKLWRASAPTPSRYGKNASLKAQLLDCFNSLLRIPPKATFLICVVALTIPATFAIFSSTFKSAEANLLQNRHVTVFLSAHVSENDARQLASNLAINKRIQSSALTPLDIQGKDILTIVIRPSIHLTSADLDHVVEELNGHPSVEFVDADTGWLQANVEAISTTKTLGILSVLLTALITSILAFGITHTDLVRHRAEYQVLNQMGASRSTVLKPFIIRSLLLATIAISTGILLTWGTIVLFTQLIDTSTYTGVFPTSVPLGLLVSLGLVAVASSTITVLLVGNRIFNSYISGT